MDDQETRLSSSLRPDQVWLLVATAVTAAAVTAHLMAGTLDGPLSPVLAVVVAGAWNLYYVTRAETRAVARIEVLRQEMKQIRDKDYAAGFVDGAGGGSDGRVVPMRRTAQ
ncbi:hypothetical protein AB0M35_17935 [Micromonospora sp. NPDC051196]|uniref:hypothetical protein n=1 Tax=Micromonospora sp. NPDC051196 TaxID=3155281 RepID=UPI0034304156